VRQWLLVAVSQCFLIEWIVHPRVNEFFLRLNERRGVNEIYVPKCVYSLEKYIYFVFLPNTKQHSWIKWRTSSVLTLRLQQSSTYHFKKMLYVASNCIYNDTMNIWCTAEFAYHNFGYNDSSHTTTLFRRSRQQSYLLHAYNDFDCIVTSPVAAWVMLSSSWLLNMKHLVTLKYKQRKTSKTSSENNNLIK